MKSNVTIKSLAARYDVHPRTLLRWQSHGVNVREPLEVAEHLTTNHKAKWSTLEIVAAELEKSISSKNQNQ